MKIIIEGTAEECMEVMKKIAGENIPAVSTASGNGPSIIPVTIPYATGGNKTEDYKWTVTCKEADGSEWYSFTI